MLLGSCLDILAPILNSLDPFSMDLFPILVHWVIHFCLKLKYEMNKNALN